MTDIIIDDDIIDGTKATSSSSSITTLRRPMFIETEVRTDTITKRRAGPTTGSRSVYDVLANTKSPTDGLPPTTYTYAHSVSYMPVTQNGSYDVPVMARRDLHGDYPTYASTSYSSNTSALSSPQRFLTNVRSQISNGYSAIKDRLTHTHHQQGAPNLNSPSSHGSSRFTRSSSQSSSNGQTTTSTTNKNYNRRGRPPVHSTPRDNDQDNENDHEEHKSSSSQHGKKHKHDDDDDDDDDNDEKGSNEDKDNLIVRFIKKILHSPMDILKSLVKTFFGLSWWLLLPLLFFATLYAFPTLLCKPLEHYPESNIYKNCVHLQEFTHNVTNGTVDYLRHQTYDRGVRNLKQLYHSANDFKDSILSSCDDIYYSIKKALRRKVTNVKGTVSDVVETTKDNAKEYCDAGLQRMHGVIDEIKREREKLLGAGHALKPGQEKELETLIRQVLDEYAADEIGQADYALEANGGKVVDTRCTEYTDEPRQNVVKFLGIPIVHMSKQPDIMIKVGRMPGQCFPFKGDQGSVVIKLAVPVKPNEFVLEHLSKSISVVGHINSAPNNFTVYALKDKHDKEGLVLGRYFYDAENGPSLQRFKPQLVNVPVVEYIEVRVTSNWGNPNYTCLYRFRVHGDLQTVQHPSAPAA